MVSGRVGPVYDQILLLEMLQKHFPVVEIAAELGLTENQVKHQKDKLGLTGPVFRGHARHKDTRPESLERWAKALPDR